MKLTFLGTRGYIDARTERHGMHSSLLLAYQGQELMIDCGKDWLGRIEEVDPDAILITHSHPDHAWGLKNGAPCPVYATRESWDLMNHYPVTHRETMSGEIHRHRRVHGGSIPVVHSTRAPAVGYRIAAGRVTIFYVPDVVYINERGSALSGVKLYVGDGATMVRSMVRKPKDTLIGHTPIRTQLTWCGKENVPRAVFTHCGMGIVTGDERVLEEKLRLMARERGVEASIAHDGMELVLR